MKAVVIDPVMMDAKMATIVLSLLTQQTQVPFANAAGSIQIAMALEAIVKGDVIVVPKPEQKSGETNEQ